MVRKFDLCRTCGAPLGDMREVIEHVRDELLRANMWLGRVEGSTAFGKDLMVQQARLLDCFLNGTHCTQVAGGRAPNPAGERLLYAYMRHRGRHHFAEELQAELDEAAGLGPMAGGEEQR